MHVLCLQVAIAAGDYLLHLLMCTATVVEEPQLTLLQWATTAKSILAV